MAIGGIPTYRTGMETLKEYFGEAKTAQKETAKE